MFVTSLPSYLLIKNQKNNRVYNQGLKLPTSQIANQSDNIYYLLLIFENWEKPPGGKTESVFVTSLSSYLQIKNLQNNQVHNRGLELSIYQIANHFDNINYWISIME